jgi:hypothetical protein
MHHGARSPIGWPSIFMSSPPICAVMATASAPTMPVQTHQLFVPGDGAGPGRSHGDARLSRVLCRRARPRRPHHRAHVPRSSRPGEARRAGRHPAQPSHLDPHLEGMGIALLALGLDGAALRSARAPVGRGAGAVVHGEKAVEAGHRPRRVRPRGLPNMSAASTGRRSRAHAPITAPARPATSRWTRPISRPAARSPCHYW